MYRALLLQIVFFICCVLPAHARIPPIKILTSIPPLASLAREIAGEDAQIKSLITKTTDPHSFELKGSDAKLIDIVDIVILVGDGYEPWAAGIKPHKVLTVAQSLDYLYEKLPNNNHYWVDPTSMIFLSQKLAERLGQLRPRRLEEFKSRQQLFEQKMIALDREITESIKSWKQQQFYSTHPTWNYFATRYGLKELGSLRNTHGREHGAQSVAQMYQITKDNKLKIIFREVHEPEQVVRSFIEDTGAREVVLDALGDPTEPYLDLIRRNLIVMSSAMKE